MGEPPVGISVPNKQDYLADIPTWCEEARSGGSRFVALAATVSGIVPLRNNKNENGEDFLLRVLQEKSVILEVYDVDQDVEDQVSEEKAWNIGDRIHGPRERYVELYLIAMKEIAPLLEQHVEHHAGLIGQQLTWKSKQNLRSLVKSQAKQKHLASKIFGKMDITTDAVIEYEQKFHTAMNGTLTLLAKYLAAAEASPSKGIH